MVLNIYKALYELKGVGHTPGGTHGQYYWMPPIKNNIYMI